MRKVLIQLISGQTMQNYIAIKHYQPDVVISLITPEYKKANQKFDVIFDNIAFIHKSCESFNITENIRIINNIIEQYNEDNIIINFTGGSKLMSTAVFFVKCPAVNILYSYVDSQNKNIHEFHLDSKGNIFESGIVSIKDFKMPFPDAFTLTGQELKDDYIKALNDSALQNKQAAREFAESASEEAFKLSAEERGKLFEEYVFGRLLSHKGKRFDELAANVRLKIDAETRRKLGRYIDGKDDKNEFDIFVSKGIIAGVIECKSNMNDVDQEMIMKVRRLASLFLGTYSKAIIISRGKVRSEQLKAKAQEHNVALLNIEEDKEQLPQKIEEILTN